MSNRCLYHATFQKFLSIDPRSILGILHDNFHGDVQTTTREAWKSEITLLQNSIFYNLHCISKFLLYWNHFIIYSHILTNLMLQKNKQQIKQHTWQK